MNLSFPILKNKKFLLFLIILLLISVAFLFFTLFQNSLDFFSKYYTATIAICPGSECPEPCTPNCQTNAKCGDSDGCGGTCSGKCSLVALPTCEKVNDSYQCVCHSSCAGKTCGSGDGCGVDCYGSCPTGQYCDYFYVGPGIPTLYACVPSCTSNCPTNAKCGQSDGCYHQCSGYCPKGYSCGANGPGSYSCKCTPYCAGKKCGASDGCGQQCPGVPSCPTNAKCGDSDGCGGICSGSCPSNQMCVSNGAGGYKCICKPNCTNAKCGNSDGCGGTCSGLCPKKNEECKYVSRALSGGYQCVKKCVPSCSGKQTYCGSGDGCGGHCSGTCPSGKTCKSAPGSKYGYECVGKNQPSNPSNQNILGNVVKSVSTNIQNAMNYSAKIFSSIIEWLSNIKIIK